jgi:VanZ family protein
VLQGDAPIMMLAADYWHTDFALVQQGTDLELWFRRIGSTDNGDPAWAVPRVFHAGRWTDLQLAVDDDRLAVAVDGVVRLDERLPAGSLQRWGDGRVALGSEVNGGGSWQGRMRTARVETRTAAVDYVRPRAVDTPDRFVEIGDHVAPFPPPNLTEWLVELLHLISFIPVGFLLVLVLGPPPRLRAAITWAAGIALAMAAAKFLFPRHTSVADLVVQVTGASLGAVLAARLLANGARRRMRHDVGPDAPQSPVDRDDHDGLDMRVGVAEGAEISGVPGAGAGQWLGQRQGGTE